MEPHSLRQLLREFDAVDGCSDKAALEADVEHGIQQLEGMFQNHLHICTQRLRDILPHQVSVEQNLDLHDIHVDISLILHKLGADSFLQSMEVCCLRICTRNDFSVLHGRG